MTISIVEQFNGEMDVSYSIPLGEKRREKFIGDEDLRGDETQESSNSEESGSFDRIDNT